MRGSATLTLVSAGIAITLSAVRSASFVDIPRFVYFEFGLQAEARHFAAFLARATSDHVIAAGAFALEKTL
jgi:hypothetical protein